MMFWILLVGLGVIAAWLVVLPALRAKPVIDESRQALNVKIFNQRTQELESDKAAGNVDEEEYQALKVELERNFLNDMAHMEEQAKLGTQSSRWLMLGMIFAVPMIALIIYKTTGYRDEFPQWVETQEAVDPLIDRMMAGDSIQEDLKEIPIADFVYGLQRRAQFDHEEAQLWFVLGNTYLQLQVADPNEQVRLIDNGTKALRRAYYLQSDNSEYALSYAQLLIRKNQGALDIESRKILNELLTLQPENPSALMTFAMASFQGKAYQDAIQAWEKLLAMGKGKNLPSRAEAILQGSIAKAKALLAKTATDDSPVALNVQVSLDANKGVDLSNGFLMVYAQAVAGPPMPLAVKKMPLPVNFPVSVTLSDEDAMIENMALSQFKEVKISARLSKTGQAIKQSGDWFGSVSPVSTKQNNDLVNVLINRQVP